MSSDRVTAGRGARRREALKSAAEKRQQRAEALRWWVRPGVLVFVVAATLAAVGWGMVWNASRQIPVEEATVDGLQLRLEEARWVLDQMDHGENFQKPSVLMPDMPEWGKQRVTLDLALYNGATEGRRFDGSELVLVPEIGEEVAPMGALVGRSRLAPGQTFNTALHFDFDTTEPHGKLRVEWRRGDEVHHLPIPEPAEHYHLRPRGGEIALPPDARLLLPIGKASRGEGLYVAKYGCVACHGDPARRGSNRVGPHLSGVANVADERRPGQPGPQYLYESLIEPNAFIAPECQDGRPCATPTAMPEYASLIDLQDAADLLAYLLSLDGEEQAG